MRGRVRGTVSRSIRRASAKSRYLKAPPSLSRSAMRQLMNGAEPFFQRSQPIAIHLAG
jgi:hypothetical protein